MAGYVPSLPTPLDGAGNIDGAAFEALCDRERPLWSSAERPPTLPPAEHGELIRMAVGVAQGRIPIIAGAGSNSTAHSIELTQHAEAARADAILSVVPYYNKPTQAGLHAQPRAGAKEVADDMLQRRTHSTVPKGKKAMLRPQPA